MAGPCKPPVVDVLDVHIISHTHDDTGYLSTVAEYYASNVRSILTTVTQELQKNPARRFTYVEIAFFALWWEEQDEPTKAVFRRLVAEGQLDFTNGGWCMPDEGSPSYQDMLYNMQKGLRYIEREFGKDARPRVAWSIDPFGHSSTYATLNAMVRTHARLPACPSSGRAAARAGGAPAVSPSAPPHAPPFALLSWRHG